VPFKGSALALDALLAPSLAERPGWAHAACATPQRPT
jgi:hypothetical protein